MSQQDLVSILIPAYKSDFFEQALLSAMAQDWQNTEIIVCDDSENDSIRIICERLSQAQKKPVRWFRNRERLLETGNVLHCLSHAKGKYVKFLYDDDVLTENCVSRLVGILAHNPNCVIASSRRTRIDENGNTLPDVIATAFPFTQDTLLNGNDLISFLCDYQVNFIGEPSVFLCYRDDLLAFGDQIFNIDRQEMPYFADVALMMKLFNKGDLAFIFEPLSSFRISDAQISQMAKHQRDQVARTYSLMPQLIKKLGWYKGNKDQNQFVTIASASSPQDTHTVNLLHALHHSLHRSIQAYQSSQIKNWVAEKSLPPQHYDLALSWHRERNVNQTLCILIRYHGDNIAVETTLASIQSWQGFGLSLHCVVFGDSYAAFSYQVDRLETNRVNSVSQINGYLTDSQYEWVMVIDAGETLLSGGLLSLDLLLESANSCDAVYFDEVCNEGGQFTGTILRPDFNLDLLLSNPTELARHWIFKRSTLVSLGGFNRMYRQAWEFEYIVRLIEQKGLHVAGHLPEPLVAAHSQVQIAKDEEKAILRNHLRQRGYPQGEVETPLPGIYALRYNHADTPLVSIIIPTKDQLAVLIPCVTTLLEKTRYKNYEVLIVDNNSETREALEWLKGIATIDPQRIRVLRYPHPFNYSAINNMAAREAHGEYLVLLNNDTAIIDGYWLDHLLNHGLRPEVGIVGAKLLYPGGNVQHAGVVMGLRGPADHPFIDSTPDKTGYMHRLQTDQNYSVVTAACMLIRKAVYEQVGGLDEEQFRVSYNDVDLCLKVREAGYLTVWTPYAVVMHEGSVSQNTVDKATQEKKRQRFMGEQDAMYQKWLPVIANDPAYNPNLSRNNAGFQLQLDAPGTWDPLHWRPLPILLTLPVDRSRSSAHHLIAQMEMLDNHALARTLLPLAPPSIGEMARIAPTSLILQQTITPAAQEWLERLRKATGQFTVFVLDDFLPADHHTDLQATLRHVDRVVVSSNALAESCAAWHKEIQVVSPALSPLMWGKLNVQRNSGVKPRIGWVGDRSTASDLDIIHSVVRQLADHVDWVVMGYCPPSLRQYVAEYHAGTSFAHYPQALASLKLDVVVEPLADTARNRHRSSIRLLEFGACGYPVICSDIPGMQTPEPVTRVKNSAKSWTEAITKHLDTVLASRQADNLHSWVHNEGLLTEASLRKRLDIWVRR